MHGVSYACAVPECRESERASVPEWHALLQRKSSTRDLNALQGSPPLPFLSSLSTLGLVIRDTRGIAFQWRSLENCSLIAGERRYPPRPRSDKLKDDLLRV